MTLRPPTPTPFPSTTRFRSTAPASSYRSGRRVRRLCPREVHDLPRACGASSPGRSSAGMISGTESGSAAAVARDPQPTARSLASLIRVWAVGDWLIPFALALVTFAVFSPALSNDFVEWDDQMNLTGNEQYRGLGPTQLKYFFTTGLLGHYIPLAWPTFGLDYVLWGMK